jgi:hypothetical protein
MAASLTPDQLRSSQGEKEAFAGGFGREILYAGRSEWTGSLAPQPSCINAATGSTVSSFTVLVTM